ncbi:MAG TPA: hypothetical protein VER03_14995 [Bryobacteraceae bacterium]|nr:hypothetical protein [Bryobacteraceae bacterium]
MSANNGDKARFHKQRKRKIASRVKMKLLAAKLREIPAEKK